MRHIFVFLFVASCQLCFGQEMEEKWKFFCENFDVAIVEGELSREALKKGKNFSVNADFFGIIEDSGTYSIAIHGLKIEKIYSTGSVMEDPDENGAILVMVDYLDIAAEKILSPKVKAGNGVFVIIWCPLALKPTMKVVARMDRKDVREALIARLSWVEVQRQNIQAEISVLAGLKR